MSIYNIYARYACYSHDVAAVLYQEIICILNDQNEEDKRILV